MKKIFLFILFILLVLFGIITLKTITAPNVQTKIEAVPLPMLPPEALKHFQEAITYQTISYGDATKWDSTPFINFRKFLDTTYPLIHQKLEREIVGNYGYIYKWQGIDGILKPSILMAHQDVVPIEESTRNMWTVDPFAGTVKDGFIWGRGTTDDKINLISIMESAEKLLKEGFQPQRTIYFVFGFDEEIGGKEGAMKIANFFQARNIKADMILDEGGILTKEKVPGLSNPVALIGTAEKGYMSLQLSVNKKGGHSSQPEKETAIDILSNAIIKIRAHPFEARFVESTKDLMKFIGPEMKFPNNAAFANSWLFKPLIINDYSKSGTGNAMIRTTAVTTIFNSGMKDNVVPTLAIAVVNFRLLPGDSIAFVQKRVREIIDDNRIEIKPYDENTSEASNTTSTSGIAFKRIDTIIKKTYSGVLSAPFLLIGATDSRHFTSVSENIIKFSPMMDPIGFHGIDERVSLESFQHSLLFFEEFLRSCK